MRSVDQWHEESVRKLLELAEECHNCRIVFSKQRRGLFQRVFVLILHELHKLGVKFPIFDDHIITLSIGRLIVIFSI